MVTTDNDSTETPATPHRVGDPLPAAMGPAELMHALGMNSPGFYKWHRLGKLKRFEFKRPIGNKKYSGRLVQAYLDSRSE